MANYEPRPIMLISKTLDKYQFLSGFITFDEGNNNSVGIATLEAGTVERDPNLLYVEDATNQIRGQIKPLPPYTFVLDQKYTTVQFETIDGPNRKKPKVKTSSSLGHTLPEYPLYNGRPFIMEDEEIVGNKAVIYAFLMDINIDDTIEFDNQNTITITQGTKPTKYTTMFVFDINKIMLQPITVVVTDPSLSPNPIDFSQAPTFAYRAVTPLVPSPNVV